MLPGLEPFSMLNLILTLAGFVAGIFFWNTIANQSGVWARLQFDESSVKRLLVRQMSIVIAVMFVLILIASVLDGFLGSFFHWTSTVAGIVFWGYLGALALTAWRGSRIER